MGKLLDAIKKKHINLNQNGSYRNKHMLDQAKPYLIQLFNKLPEEKRYELLNEFLSPEAKERTTADGFVEMLKGIRKQGKEASRKFLTNSDNFGKDWHELLVPMENRLEGWVDHHYTEASVHHDSPDDDKLVALFGSDTFERRMYFLWDQVDEKRKPAYQRQFLNEITEDPEKSALRFDEKGVFAEGKDWEKFAEAIEASLDDASLDEAARNIKNLKEPEFKFTVGELLGTVDRTWSEGMDKMQFLMQNAMLTKEEKLDAYNLNEKANSSEWQKSLNPLKKINKLNSKGKLKVDEIVDRSKRIINLAEKPEDKIICRDAALQNYRNLQSVVPADQQSSEDFKEMKLHAAALQEDVVKSKYKDDIENVNTGRDYINKQIKTIEKEKDGIFLSKKNSPEHNRMTKGLRLFNAKLDIVLKNKTDLKLSPEELEKVKNTDIKELFDEAKEATFNYSCLKTKNGKGRILHDDGIARNKASRNTFYVLNQIGTRLGLNDQATEVKDDIALTVLKKRGSKTWEKENAVDCAAKTIFAMSLTKDGVPPQRQAQLLKENVMERYVKDIKEQDAFKQMVKDLGPSGICEAIVKDSNALALAYGNALKKTQSPQAGTGETAEATAEKTNNLNQDRYLVSM